MTLSRMDEEESPLKLSDFAVSEAVEETAESFRDFARSQGHPLELAIVPGLTYCGDEYAVRQLVSILLDNAVKYALPETAIRFVLEKGKRGVVLRCSNACAPLAEGETEKLFDRFYRSDQARSADGSFGVGLSIARSIAEGHHGFIRAQCPQPGEIVFTACGSEGNNLAVLGAVKARAAWADHIVVTGYEHPSVQNPVAALEKEGWRVTVVRPDAENSRKNDSF